LKSVFGGYYIDRLQFDIGDHRDEFAMWGKNTRMVIQVPGKWSNCSNKAASELQESESRIHAVSTWHGIYCMRGVRSYRSQVGNYTGRDHFLILVFEPEMNLRPPFRTSPKKLGDAENQGNLLSPHTGSMHQCTKGD
jgi:hypothetical protein